MLWLTDPAWLAALSVGILAAQAISEIAALIADGARWLNIGWKSMHRGYVDLTSVFVGDEADLQQSEQSVSVIAMSSSAWSSLPVNL